MLQALCTDYGTGRAPSLSNRLASHWSKAPPMRPIHLLVGLGRLRRGNLSISPWDGGTSSGASRAHKHVRRGRGLPLGPPPLLLQPRRRRSVFDSFPVRRRVIAPRRTGKRPSGLRENARSIPSTDSHRNSCSQTKTPRRKIPRWACL